MKGQNIGSIIIYIDETDIKIYSGWDRVHHTEKPRLLLKYSFFDDIVSLAWHLDR